MTLSSDRRKAREQQLRDERAARSEKSKAKRPWLLPAITVAAIVIVIAGITTAAMLGIRFF